MPINEWKKSKYSVSSLPWARPEQFHHPKTSWQVSYTTYLTDKSVNKETPAKGRFTSFPNSYHGGPSPLIIMLKMIIAVTQSIFKLGPSDFAWKYVLYPGHTMCVRADPTLDSVYGIPRYKKLVFLVRLRRWRCYLWWTSWSGVPIPTLLFPVTPTQALPRPQPRRSRFCHFCALLWVE